MGGSVPHAVGRPAKESPDRLTWGRPPPGASVPQKGLEARPSGRSPSGLTSGASAAIAASRPGKGEGSPGARLPLVAWDGPPHGLAGLGLTRRGGPPYGPSHGTCRPTAGGWPTSRARGPRPKTGKSAKGSAEPPCGPQSKAPAGAGLRWWKRAGLPAGAPSRGLARHPTGGGLLFLAPPGWIPAAAAPGGLLPSPGILAVAGEGEDAPSGLLLPLRPPGRPPSPLVPRWPPPPPGSSPKAS